MRSVALALRPMHFLTNFIGISHIKEHLRCSAQFYGSLIPTLFRGGTGAYVLPGVDKWKRPAQPIEMYDIQRKLAMQTRTAHTSLCVDEILQLMQQACP